MKSIIQFLIKKLLFGINYKNKILKSHSILKSNKQTIETKVINLKENIEKYLYQKRKNNLNSYELTLSQFIFKNLINNKYFNEKLILEKCLSISFYYPLPKEYLIIIKNNGFRVNFFISKIYWGIFIFGFLIYNLFIIIKSLFFLSKHKIKEDNHTIIYLDSLPNICPIENLNDDLPDFYKWFSNFFIKEKKINKNIIFFHDNKSIKNTTINYKNIFSYKLIFKKNFILRNLKLINYIKAFKNSLILIFKLGFSKSLILKELIYCEYAQLNKDCLPDYALFNMSNMTLQPLWSTIKNKNNDQIDFLYYYSTNIVPLVENPDLAPNVFGYRIQSWNNYIFWNNNHRKWVEKCAKRNINSTVINNYIPFEGKNISIIKSKNKRIIIFDIPPRNDFVYYNFMHVGNIYSYEYCSKFFEDVVSTIKKSFKQVEIFYKIKRDISSINSEYKNKFLNAQTKIDGFKIFYDEVSAQSLIKACDASISIPFTSTVLIADYLKKPSVYYNPSQVSLRSNFSENDNNLINNKPDLETWLNKVCI